MGGIGQFFGTLFGPIGQIFHFVFYLPIYNVLMLLYEGVHALVPVFPAFAIAIFLLTIIIRLCLFPLTRKQLQSSRAMQALQPEVKKLQQQYKGDQQAFVRAQQALYREHGVSMMGGCLPMLIQLPFLYGLYYSLYTALLAPKSGGHPLPPAEVPAAMLKQINADIYPFLPHLTLHTLPATTFLWTNLASPDPFWILPILAGVLTFLQLRMAQPVRKPTPPGQKQDSTAQAMTSMQYVMPFITVFIGISFPSGLAFYWCISTAFSAVQQYLLTGWGSLFVGIPGMEHLVPAPQDFSVPPARSTSLSSSRALTGDGLSSPRQTGSSGRGIVVDAAPEERPTGLGASLGALRSMLRQLAAPPAASHGSANGNGANGANGAANGNSATGKGRERPAVPFAVTGSAGPESDAENRAATPATPVRQARPDRSGPTLVKPVGSSGGNDAANGKSNSNGTPAANGVGGAGRAAAAKGAGSASAARGGGNSGRNGQAARRRSGGRSKGGR